MKLSSWMILAAAGLVVGGACTTRRVHADDDDGGSGVFVGAGGAGGDPSAQSSTVQQVSSTAASTVASTVAVSSTSSGPQGCDSNVSGDIGDTICDGCIQCTQSGPCASEWNACSPNSPCDLYIQCAFDCDTQCNGDPMCFETCFGISPDPNDPCSPQTPAGTCIGDHSAGCTDYIQAMSCSVCLECPINCNANGNCL